MAKRVRILLLIAMAIVAATAHGGSYNSPECDLIGNDCWECVDVGWLNVPFCWPLLGANSGTGRCGCRDQSPHINNCEPLGEFCGNIWVWG